jgi:hypothetical protein
VTMDRDDTGFNVALALIGVLGFCLTLDLAYVKIVHPIYASTGFTFSPSVLAYAESFLVLVIVTIVALVGKCGIPISTVNLDKLR